MANKKSSGMKKIINKLEKENIPTLQDIKNENDQLVREEKDFQKKFKIKNAKRR